MAKTIKKKNRKLRRQVRKTVGALLMVSAITVAAIPVREMQASPSDYTPIPKWVKCLNFTSNISNGSGTWEDCPSGGDAITEWESSVPLVDVDITKYPIYTTSTTNNTVPYRFAFVPSEPASGTNVAVILGTEKQKISNNTLTIDSVVDAYKKYSYNTSATNYCAVSMDDSFLFYPTKFQRRDGTVGYWKVINNEYEPAYKNSTYNDIEDGYIRHKEENPSSKKTAGAAATEGETCDYLRLDEIMKTDTSVEPAIKILDVVKTTYSVEAYEVEEPDSNGDPVPVTKYRWKEDVDHNIYQLEMSMIDGMQPCYDNTESVWVPLGDAGLYYYTGAAGTTPDLNDMSKFEPCNSIANKQRIHDVDVWYIGQQYVEATEEGVWKIAGKVDGTDPYKGIFSDLKNVTTLNLPSSLQGIGDYAFYGSQIKTVNFHADGRIKTIGNYSFANCVSLSEVNIPLYSNVTVLGEGAFWNDYSLASFIAPTSLCAIGDFAFSDCTGLQMVDLTSQGNANYLNAIGFHAFENCTGLTSIEFPEKFKQDSAGLPATIKNKVPINSFKGCININHFTFNNNALDIADGLDPDEAEDTNHAYRSDGNDATDCDIDKFVAALNDPDGFYLEGIASEYWPAYQTAKDHRIAYKHLGEEIYERWVECSESPQHVNTFIVNATGDITAMTLEPGCTEVVIPERIGKIGIKKLTGTSFTDNCSLKKVYIPQSIEMIESGAFKGCHNLETVIFTQPENPNLVIENGAFATQNVGVHKTGCTTPLKQTPYLLFVGTVSDAAAPFQYAMDPANHINVGSQTADSYIYFSSGWPANLLVKYDPDTDKNTLIDYPRYTDISTLKDKKVTVGTEDYEYVKSYLTGENIAATSTAIGSYEYWKNHPNTTAPTGDELGIVNAALNPVLPSGIEAIQTGLFSGLETDGAKLTGVTTDTSMESIMMYTVEEVEPYTFAGCTRLARFEQNPIGGVKIGEYAFRNCTDLGTASVAATVTDLGIRPFMGCDDLTYVDFADSPYFECRDAIIFGKDNSGARTKIVECLECRGKTFGNAKVGPEELADVKEMEQEAFMDCDGIGQVDLTSSSLKAVSAKGFALTEQLGSVKLPETCTKIEKGAFWDSGLYYVEVPASVTLINPEAFADVETEDKYKEVACQADQYIKYQANGDPYYEHQSSNHKIITASCVEDSAMDTFASDYYYINPEYFIPTIYHTVYFWDTYISKSNPDLIESQKVIDGQDAVPPAFPEHDGVVPSAWTPNYKGIVRDTDVTTVYSGEMHKVWFQYTDMTDPDNPKVIKLTEEQWVEHGKTATPPSQNPYNDGYVFTGWTPDYRNIYDDGPIIAVFKSSSPDDRHTVTFYDHEGNLVASYKVDDGGSVVAPAGPARAGYTFVGWAPNKFTDIQSDIVAVASYEKIVPSPAPGGGGGGASPAPGGGGSKTGATPAPTATPNPADSVKKYTVSVSGGSGSGSYPAGAVVAINAYDRGAGQVFDKWTTSSAGVGFANAEVSSTTFVMPAANVAVTATYKTGNGSSSSSGGSSGGSGSTNSRTNNGTTVQVTKPGISNTNLAGATVSGATDNFIVKVTEDDAAARAVTAALQARYGDLSRIKYLPMDISLYDSEGRTKIADTTGISVNLTLPLPDDLIQYAGNNKVAAIAGGALEDLNTRFTTVDGVPCVNFTATHFSPYVIYVDTANLTQATMDSTPKTGDPIHPKWFLAIGLACISLILFFKRDKVAVKPA